MMYILLKDPLILLIVFLVELLLYYNSGEGLLAYLHFQWCSQLVVWHLNESHAEALVGRDGVVAGGHLAYHLAVLHNGIAMARNGLSFEFDANETALNAVLLLVNESLAANEFGLVELAEHAKTGHNRRDFG